jgi:hypothetical protein
MPEEAAAPDLVAGIGRAAPFEDPHITRWRGAAAGAIV